MNPKSPHTKPNAPNGHTSDRSRLTAEAFVFRQAPPAYPAVRRLFARVLTGDQEGQKGNGGEICNGFEKNHWFFEKNVGKRAGSADRKTRGRKGEPYVNNKGHSPGMDPVGGGQGCDDRREYHDGTDPGRIRRSRVQSRLEQAAADRDRRRIGSTGTDPQRDIGRSRPRKRFAAAASARVAAADPFRGRTAVRAAGRRILARKLGADRAGPDYGGSAWYGAWKRICSGGFRDRTIKVRSKRRGRSGSKAFVSRCSAVRRLRSGS